MNPSSGPDNDDFFSSLLGDFPVAESQAARILTLPVHQFLDEDDIAYVLENLSKFLGTSKVGSGNLANKAA